MDVSIHPHASYGGFINVCTSTFFFAFELLRVPAMFVCSLPLKSSKKLAHDEVLDTLVTCAACSCCKCYRLLVTKWQHSGLCFHGFKHRLLTNRTSKGAGIAQCVGCPTETPHTIQMLVCVLSAARDFSSMFSFHCRPSYGVPTALLCNGMHQHLCAHSKSPHGQPYHYLDTRQCCTH